MDHTVLLVELITAYLCLFMDDGFNK